MNQERPKLFLLDAMALIYRAFFALNKNPRINSKGLNTSAILGFANTLMEVLANEKPSHIGVAFDTIAPTQRHLDFAEYKANREKMPEDLEKSLPYIIELIRAFNIPLLLADGFEADDIIGTLARRAEDEGFDVFMMTPDKDFGQLVTDNIKIYKPSRGGEKPEIWGIEEVCSRFGIKQPEQLIDILGLWGDASDNIPGIPGVGEKTAIKLISEYGSIENLLAHTDEQKGKLRENLEQYGNQGLQSKQLATILTDAPVSFDAEDLKMAKPDFEKLSKLFEELEFRTFAKRVVAMFSDDKAPEVNLFSQTDEEIPPKVFDYMHIGNTPHNYHLISNKEDLVKLADRLMAAGSFCFDTETTGIDAHQAEIVGISFCMQPGEAWYVPLPDNYHEACTILAHFKPVLEDPDIEKTGQNLKYDISVLRWYDIEVKGPLFDTMIAHYLIEPDQRHNMDYLATSYLNYTPVSIESLIGKKGKQQGSMRDVELEQIKEYAAEDADITLQLRNILEPKLSDQQAMRLMKEVEMPLLPVLAGMEAEGVKIDIETLRTIGDELGHEIEQIEQEIYRTSGSLFNIGSPKQLGEVLFEKLGLSTNAKKTKTGQYPTGEEVLSRMVHDHPVVPLILDYRSLTKLKSTYVDTLPELVNPRDNRIHTTYNQAVAATGRLSSNNPNLQNIPIRTERGREIRKAFVPRNPDFVLLAADYSQIELRIIAHLSGDQSMIEAFAQGLDIHTATAAKVYGLPLEKVDRDMRRNAKMVNFGIIYGISAFGLAERLGIPRKEASEIIQNYFREYPGIKAYMNSQIEFARKNGYVETMLGRRRYLRDINSSNSVVRGFAERNAINAPIQGSSADMIKIAMIRIHEQLTAQKLQSKMILQVHDELVFDVLKPELEQVQHLVLQGMKDALKLDVPVLVEMSTGTNWLEAH